MITIDSTDQITPKFTTKLLFHFGPLPYKLKNQDKKNLLRESRHYIHIYTSVQIHSNIFIVDKTRNVEQLSRYKKDYALSYKNDSSA